MGLGKLVCAPWDMRLWEWTRTNFLRSHVSGLDTVFVLYICWIEQYWFSQDFLFSIPVLTMKRIQNSFSINTVCFKIKLLVSAKFRVWEIPGGVVKLVALLRRILEVPRSNHSPKIGCPDWNVVLLSSLIFSSPVVPICTSCFNNH
jgi:hypothetical protein